MSRWEHVEGFVRDEKTPHGTGIKRFHISVGVVDTCLSMDIRVTLEDLGFFPELYGETLDKMTKQLDKVLNARNTRLRMENSPSS